MDGVRRTLVAYAAIDRAVLALPHAVSVGVDATPSTQLRSLLTFDLVAASTLAATARPR